jgi:hypothetical protein
VVWLSCFVWTVTRKYTIVPLCNCFYSLIHHGNGYYNLCSVCNISFTELVQDISFLDFNIELKIIVILWTWHSNYSYFVAMWFSDRLYWHFIVHCSWLFWFSVVNAANFPLFECKSVVDLGFSYAVKWITTFCSVSKEIKFQSTFSVLREGKPASVLVLCRSYGHNHCTVSWDGVVSKVTS